MAFDDDLPRGPYPRRTGELSRKAPACNRFDTVALVFKTLCKRFKLPVPRVLPSLPTDPCDFTSVEEVRINVKAAGEIDFLYHAQHVFGHYVCGLHEYENNGNQDWADPVADMIAELLEMKVPHEH